jgi:RNA polymerase sigma-70 factor, ECF subfamily
MAMRELAAEDALRVRSLDERRSSRADAFEWLTETHLDRAYRLAWAILGNDAEAQDATQDAFAAAWRMRGSLRDVDKADAWLSRIVVNRCRDRLRQRSRSRTHSIDDRRGLGIGSAPDGSAETSSRDELDRVLAGLDPDHRIVVVLRFWADLTVEEIAVRVGVPCGTVKSRLHYAIRAMRTALEGTR